MKEQIIESVFGLDIGTRTVIGVLGYHKDTEFVVTYSTCIAHEERAMLDGQIHDIHKVAKMVQKVKQELEIQSNRVLTEVAIAAAGRVLNTQIITVTEQFDESQEITQKDIEELEVHGIDKAKNQLEIEKKVMANEYFCVGHTVIEYFLDDYVITNLEGHKGCSIGAKVLCTFLPKSVIDSLYAVTDRVGLEVTHLTLEPIAAINAIIPQNLRRLNLALVDIGAGTSDVAITKEGSVVAYGMIPLAGDEVTEAIMNQYLVDFNTAEKIKQQIGTEEKIQFEDIIGIAHEVTSKEIGKHIMPIIKKLAQTIGDKILELNGGKETSAVFCVGGGSQMSGLTSYLAKALQLPNERVAVRTGLQVTDIKFECDMPLGPETITPLGICITAIKEEKQKFVRVKINDKEVQLLNSKKLTVLDALIHEGMDHTQLFPKRGKTLMFSLNEERIRIKGESGEIATILLNDRETTLNTPVHNQDTIKIHRATEGRPLVVTIRDYVPERRKIYINHEAIYLPIILVNGDSVDLEYQIVEKDKVEILNIGTLGELVEKLKIDEDKVIRVNQTFVLNTYTLNEEDSILIEDRLEELEDNESVREEIKEEEIAKEIIEVRSQEITQEEYLTLSVNGKNINLPIKKNSYVFVNIFDYIDFDLTRPQGSIILKLNDVRAAFTDELKDRDKLEIYWEK